MKTSTRKNIKAAVLYALAFGLAAVGYWFDGDLTRACVGLGLFGFANTLLSEVIANSMLYEDKNDEEDRL